MKTTKIRNPILLICLAIGLWITASTAAQAQFGYINFVNTPPARYITNGVTMQKVTGSNYKVSLYYGANPSILSPAATTSFSPVSGLFNGGLIQLPPYYPGDDVYVQLRAWYPATYSSYEAAVASGDPSVVAGVSSIALKMLGDDVFYDNVSDLCGFYLQPVASLGGSLQVNIAPAAAVSGGAQWRVDNGSWQNSGATVSGLLAGPHGVDFKTVSGWALPENSNVWVTDNVTTTVTGTYRFPFTYVTNGSAITITGYIGSDSSVIIPGTINSLPVTSIGHGAFSSRYGLTSVVISNSLTSIEALAFSDCSSLTNVTMGNGVASIGLQAFYGCSSLTNIFLPNSLTSIGGYAFSHTGLKNITIPSSVTNIGNGPFWGCLDLPAITVNPLNAFFTNSVDGVLFDKGQTLLIQYPTGKTGNYAIPNGVTLVGPYAFADNDSLNSVTIPTGVTGIGAGAFSGCSSLTGVYFQGNAPVNGSDDYVFSGAPATVYYLLGTSGWSSTFDGRPTALWNPQAQTSGSSFGVKTNRFGFSITGTANITIVVEASTNLVNWSPVSTNTLTSGTSYFSDPQWTNFLRRYYRLAPR